MPAQCYAIDGNPYPDSRYIPCNQTAADNGLHTQCCAPGDVCLTNGLCQESGGNKNGVNLFWRNGCTDSTWSDSACLNQCASIGDPKSRPVHYCLEKESWCCPTGNLQDTGAQTNLTCCTIPDLQFSALDPVVYTTAVRVVAISTLSVKTSSSTTSVTSSSIASSTVSNQSTSSPTLSSQSSQASESAVSVSESGSGSSSKLGIYVGVPIGVVFLVAIGFIAWFMRRRRNAARSAAQSETPSNHGIPEMYHDDTKRPHYAEADVGQAPLRAEADTKREPSELSGGVVPVAELPDRGYT